MIGKIPPLEEDSQAAAQRDGKGGQSLSEADESCSGFGGTSVTHMGMINALLLAVTREPLCLRPTNSISKHTVTSFKPFLLNDGYACNSSGQSHHFEGIHICLGRTHSLGAFAGEVAFLYSDSYCRYGPRQLPEGFSKVLWWRVS